MLAVLEEVVGGCMSAGKSGKCGFRFFFVRKHVSMATLKDRMVIHALN